MGLAKEIFQILLEIIRAAWKGFFLPFLPYIIPFVFFIILGFFFCKKKKIIMFLLLTTYISSILKVLNHLFENNDFIYKMYQTDKLIGFISISNFIEFIASEWISSLPIWTDYLFILLITLLIVFPIFYRVKEDY